MATRESYLNAVPYQEISIANLGKPVEFARLAIAA
jgi:hypothetical protein